MPISLNVNVDKVDKDRFFKGKNGRYLDLILWETPDSDYGDYMVKQQGKKGEKMPILGNAKKVTFKKKEENTDEPTDTTGTGNQKDPW